jgi:hypothetical protein
MITIETWLLLGLLLIFMLMGAVICYLFFATAIVGSPILQVQKPSVVEPLDPNVILPTVVLPPVGSGKPERKPTTLVGQDITAVTAALETSTISNVASETEGTGGATIDHAIMWINRVDRSYSKWATVYPLALFRSLGLSALNVAHAIDRLDLQLAQAAASPDNLRELQQASRAWENLQEDLEKLNAELRGLSIMSGEQTV